ncbi:MAG: hypothetical protein ACK5LR_10015 [Mangrovibacterium sp.]
MIKHGDNVFNPPAFQTNIAPPDLPLGRSLFLQILHKSIISVPFPSPSVAEWLLSAAEVRSRSTGELEGA